VWPAITSCYLCSPGSSLPVDGYVSGLDLRTGTATIGATLYPFVTWSHGYDYASAFRITGPTITLNHGPGTYTGNFSFTGSLCGFTSAWPSEGPCTVDLPELTGSGQVTVTILPDAGNLLHSGAATYTFTSVPEPSGIVLVGTAALILLGRRRRRSMRLV
jgi:hypothetical protein